MWGTTLLLALALGQAPKADPAELVARLGSKRYADREAASVALEEMGRAALSALRAARDLRDPEIRNRAATLIVKIEGAMLTQPSRLRLNFEDQPLADVARSLSDQMGLKITLMPEEAPHWKTRKVTLVEPDALSFWQAIDRLCDEAHLQYNQVFQPQINGREVTFPLYEGGMRPTNPVYDSGPFRVILTQLHFQRDVNFFPRQATPRNRPERGLPGTANAPRTNARVDEQLNATLQLVGEPRLSVAQNGMMKVTEALDDKGQNLIPANSNGNGNVVQQMSRSYGFVSGSMLQLQAMFTRPEQPGATIRSFKGTIPVIVSARKPDPLVVPLEGASGKTFQNDDASITVNAVQTMANTNQTSIDLSIRETNTGGLGPNDGAVPMFPNNLPNNNQHPMEITDSQGRTLPWFTRISNGSGRVTLTLTAPNQPANGLVLRYYGVVRASTDVPFEFTDLPLP